MTAVLKTTVKPRAKTLAHIMSETFGEFSSLDDGRTIRILCSNENFAEHGDNWYQKAKSAMSEVSRLSDNPIAHWQETEYEGRYCLEVSMTKEIATSKEVFAGELFLTLGRELKGVVNIKSVAVVSGSDVSGTLHIIYDKSDFDSELERADAISELRSRVKVALKQHYGIKSCVFGTMTNTPSPKFGGLAVIYK